MMIKGKYNIKRSIDIATELMKPLLGNPSFRTQDVEGVLP